MAPHRTTIEAYFLEHPPATAKEAAAKIAELTGITRSANQTRLFLKKCGMRWRVTGVLPAKADPDKQEDFKKNTGAPVSRSPSRNTRNLVGRCAAADKAYPRLMLSDKVYRLRINRQRCTPAFLVDLLALPLIRQRIEECATGASASMLNIDRRTILELDIVLPPLDVQFAIVQRIQGERQGISRLVEHVASEIALLRELRAATITDAVTGKIQVS